MSLGHSLSEEDFSATILESLPRSYDQFLLAITATASILKQELEPKDLMQAIINKYDRQSTQSRNQKDKGSDAAFYAGGNKGKTSKKSDNDIKCFNCHKKGHKKIDCWAKGGEKEGQGPRSKSKKEEPKKETANAVDKGEGVWIAVVSDSDNENMADDEFDDFTILDNNLFFEDNDGNTEAILTKNMKNLKISETSKPITHPYDNVYDFCKDSMDSSDDDNNATGAAAMSVESEEEIEMEVNPYWTKINVNKLQALGSPTIILFSNTNSMPDLVTVLTVSDSEDSIIFVFSRSGTSCTNDSKNERKLALFSDKEMIILDEDNGEEGLTTFDTAMLVNVEGNVKGIQTELYDSGTS